MHSLLKKTVASVLLAATSFTAVQLLFKSESATKGLFPILAGAKKSGQYPDGISLRTRYTGIEGLDNTLATLVAIFSLLVDGQDKMTHRFVLWFLPQLAPLVVHIYWEAGRRKSPFVRLYVLVVLCLCMCL